MRDRARWFHLLRQLLVRDLRQRWMGSFSGALWAVLQPLALLGIYGVVFVEILKVRLPDRVGTDFVPFLVTALWPWTAFAESINRSVNAFPDHAALLSKVALPRELLVLAPAGSSFLVHIAGFVAVLLALLVFGKPLHAAGAPVALVGTLLLAIFSVGLALLFASLQVFVRDFGQALGQFLTLWFFLTPVFFVPEMLPPQIAEWMALNPMAAFIGAIRGPLLGTPGAGWASLLLPALYAVAALGLGFFVFRRLQQHFEDFL
jgi:lipopolysaccharide transport system permease protein